MLYLLAVLVVVINTVLGTFLWILLDRGRDELFEYFVRLPPKGPLGVVVLIVAINLWPLGIILLCYNLMRGKD